MSLTRKLGMVAAAAAAVTGLVSAPAAAGPSPVAAPAAKVSTGKFVIAMSEPGEVSTKDDPPLFHCEWRGVAYPAGSAMNHEATFACGQGPSPLADIQSKLYSDKGALEHIAPKDGPLLNARVTSKGTFWGVRPNTQHYVRMISHVELIPDVGGKRYWWYTLPEGCTGLGGPIADCDLKVGPFAF